MRGRRLIAVLATAFLGSAVLAAAPGSTVGAEPGCIPGPNAPRSMNEIRAFDGCGPTDRTAPGTSAPSATAAPSAAAQSLTTAAATLNDSITVPASTPIGARINFARTNGDILAINKVQGASRNLIAFGGNFTAVIGPDGVSRPATHFAVVDEDTGALVYGGSASSYVRAVTSWNGTIYVGGDFTSIGGVARSYVAAIGPDFKVTSWNPGSGARIRAILAGPLGVYFGGDTSTARLVNATTGAGVWSQAVSGGGIRSFALTPDGSQLFVGGLFEVYGGLTRHGLIRGNPSTGVPDPAFNANLRVDTLTGPYGTYDGEAAVALQITPDGRRVVTGIAGHGSDEIKIFNSTTGALIWVKVTPGDCQAVAVVGSTYVCGYHRNRANGTIPYPYFVAQLESSNSQLTNWDPKLTGNQSNADGGNLGVQAMYADPVAHRLFVAGAFTTPVQSLAVYPWTPPVNQPPEASFTSSTSQNLTASFNASTSSDPDGPIAAYDWTFGDGTTGSGITTQHTYAVAGTYTVTLKITDAEGATSSMSALVTVPASSLYALDSFSRTVTSGFGTADLGGVWNVVSPGQIASVSNGAGQLTIPAATGVTASLDGIQKASTEVTSRLTFNQAATGGGIYTAVLGRRIDASNDYRMKVRVQAGGAVSAQLVRRTSGAETVVQNISTVPGLTIGAGQTLRVRFRVTGTGTTQLSARVWKDGTTEPSSWLLQASDTTAGLQAAGSVGLWGYLSSSATTTPVTVSVDDFSAGPPA